MVERKKFTPIRQLLRRRDSRQEGPARDPDTASARTQALEELAAMDHHTRDAVTRIREGREPGRLTSPRTGESPYLSVLVTDTDANTILHEMDQTGEAPDDVVNRALKLLGRVERLRQDGATFYVAEKKLFQRTRVLRKLYFPQ